LLTQYSGQSRDDQTGDTMSTAGQSPGAVPQDQINAMRAQETRMPWMMTIYVVLHTVALVAVTLRVYVRAIMIKQFGIDDALMVAAAVGHDTSAVSSELIMADTRDR
jgi:hypothetical protein